jgi:hypothetical protein
VGLRHFRTGAKNVTVKRTLGRSTGSPTAWLGLRSGRLSAHEEATQPPHYCLWPQACDVPELHQGMPKFLGRNGKRRYAAREALSSFGQRNDPEDQPLRFGVEWYGIDGEHGNLPFGDAVVVGPYCQALNDGADMGCAGLRSDTNG